MRVGFITLILLLVFAFSCAPFPQETMREVEKDIAFEDVLKDPGLFQGKVVLWGGVIIEAVNRPDVTLIIVRQTELDFQKQPKDLDKSAGRFIVRHEGFLDPAIYSKDRELTVSGAIAGKEERVIGERRYIYPVIDARDIRLWEKRTEVPYYYDPWYGPYPFWGAYPYPYGWRRHPYWW